MQLNPFTGISIQVSPDFPVFKFVRKKAKRKWGPKYQRVKVISHYCNALKDGEVIKYQQQSVWVMNPRTKAELDKAISAENRRRGHHKFMTHYGVRLNSEPLGIVRFTV